MGNETVVGVTAILGYARVSTAGQDLGAQLVALSAAGVSTDRVLTDKLSGSAKAGRPGLAAMLDYARAGDTVVVTAIDRLGRSVAEVTRTIAELGERRIMLRALREGVDTATPTGRAVAAIMATLAELELELDQERRAASRESRRTRQLPATKPHKLSHERQEQLRRLVATGEPVRELAAASHATPAAVITHTIATIRGQQLADLSVYHARTPDVRIALTWGGVLMHIWSCQAAQGLLEAFSAARAAMARVPREIPPPATPLDEPFAPTTLAVDWTRRPTYAVVPQSGPSKSGGNILNWVDLYTGPLTWRIRDHAGLRSTIELLAKAHKTAIAVCPDGDRYSADPTTDDHKRPEERPLAPGRSRAPGAGRAWVRSGRFGRRA